MCFCVCACVTGGHRSDSISGQILLISLGDGDHVERQEKLDGVR